MFEDQYMELAIAVGDIAERIRILDIAAPGTYKEFTRLSLIHAGDGVPNAIEINDVLLVVHEIIVKTARDVLKVVHQSDDESTVPLVCDRMRMHEKHRGC
ncbi:MAG: starvation-inducible DNA-binding protein [Granulosicoccus sp.]|jgi:starvation-inducible DNA-binding protein